MEGMSEILESLPDTPQDQGPVDVIDDTQPVT
jgi:hypothetical protein